MKRKTLEMMDVILKVSCVGIPLTALISEFSPPILFSVSLVAYGLAWIWLCVLPILGVISLNSHSNKFDNLYSDNCGQTFERRGDQYILHYGYGLDGLEHKNEEIGENKVIVLEEWKERKEK